MTAPLFSPILPDMEPSYLALARSGELAQRARAAVARLAACDLCPRGCGVNRLAGEAGFCRIGRNAVLADYHQHYGEEACLVGSGGSGTLFFSGCSLACEIGRASCRERV